jgi:hypothetical protein
MNSELVIPEIDKYTMKIINNTLILTPVSEIKIMENIELKIEKILKNSFSKSKIQKCTINDIIHVELKKYNQILLHIYSLIDKKIILNNTKLNIKTEEKRDRGFVYHQNIGLSIQGADSNKTMSEILNMCKIQNIKLDLEILMLDNSIFNINT